MTWSHLPHQQQRGAQWNREGAPEEAVEDRSAQGHKYADLDLAPDGEPQRDIDYPATNPEGRDGDITPTLAEEGNPEWEDIVQPEDHARQTPSGEQRERTDALGQEHAGPSPLPEGK